MRSLKTLPQFIHASIIKMKFNYRGLSQGKVTLWRNGPTCLCILLQAYLWLNVSKYRLHLIRVYSVHICLCLYAYILVLIPLPRNLGMVYDCMYMNTCCCQACRNAGSEKPFRWNCTRVQYHISIIIIPKLAA